MNDWKKDLDKKAQQLNIKEETDGYKTNRSISTNRSNSSGSDNNIVIHQNTSSTNITANSRSSDLVRGKETKQINTRGGKETMIGIEGALSDVDDVVSKGIYTDRDAKKEIALTTDLEKLGAIVKILLKFLSTIRSNQLLTDADKVIIKSKKTERIDKK